MRHHKGCLNHRPVRPNNHMSGVELDRDMMMNEGVKGASEKTDDDDGEEAQEAKMRGSGTYKPSDEEVRLHNLTHMPFRSWCSACVRGAAKDWPHKTRSTEDHLYPEVHFDYCFLRDQPGQPAVPILVGKEI